jgi:hypothetical protein
VEAAASAVVLGSEVQTMIEVEGTSDATNKNGPTGQLLPKVELSFDF